MMPCLSLLCLAIILRVSLCFFFSLEIVLNYYLRAVVVKLLGRLSHFYANFFKFKLNSHFFSKSLKTSSQEPFL